MPGPAATSGPVANGPLLILTATRDTPNPAHEVYRNRVLTTTADALFRDFKQLCIRHQVEHGVVLSRRQGLFYQDIAIRRGGFLDAMSSEYNNKANLISTALMLTHKRRFACRMTALIEKDPLPLT